MAKRQDNLTPEQNEAVREALRRLIVWVGCGRSFVTMLGDGETGRRLESMGFRRIECERPYTHTRTTLSLRDP